MAQRQVAASGTVRVRNLDTGEEWDEKVEVFERDIEDEMTVEDMARDVAVSQAEPAYVETLEVDVS